MDEKERTSLNNKFNAATPQEILSWAINEFPTGVAVSSSFGAMSAVLLHMATQIKPDIPVLFLNTGFLFKETLTFVDRLKKDLNLNLKEFKASSAEIKIIQEKLKNPNNIKGQCCDNVKVRLMQESLKGVNCWIAGLRRAQGGQRKSIEMVEGYASGLVKVHPLAHWSSKDLGGYLKQHDLPYHPLFEQGYTSVGCEPCTSRPDPSQGERSGRWKGMEKEECGIHTFLEKKKGDK